MKKIITVLLFLLVACGQQTSPTQTPPLKPMEGPTPSGLTTTQDGQTIAYQYYPNPGKPGIILLHMLRRTRADWHTIAEWLQQNGYAVIVPDLRGHGQSTGNWEQYKPEDFNKMVKDVAAMKSVLQNNKADTTKLTIIGASIGANTAYNYALTDKDVKTIILLSPGLDYRGLTLSNEKYNNQFLVVASTDDAYSAQSSQELKNKNPTASIIMYEDAGHGTNMFTKNDLAPTILNWIKEHVY